MPDVKTQERRDWFHAHRKAVKRSTQMRNRLLSYLSDNGVRLKKGTPLATGKAAEEQLRQTRPWSPRQWQVIEGMLMELRHADEQRSHWRSLIAQEVLSDPQLLSIVRLCGVREMVAFALGALIGDIRRFANPKKLVKYIGLNPAFDDSGEGQWSGGIAGHGRKDLRSLLVEAAQAVLRCSKNPLAQWGKKLLRRKSSVNLTVGAMARKLAVAVWYLMMGRWTPLEEIDERLALKVGKIITSVGARGLKKLGKTRKTFRQEIYQSLQTTKIYVLDYSKKFTPKPVLHRSLSSGDPVASSSPFLFIIQNLQLHLLFGTRTNYDRSVTNGLVPDMANGLNLTSARFATAQMVFVQNSLKKWHLQRAAR